MMPRKVAIGALVPLVTAGTAGTSGGGGLQRRRQPHREIVPTPPVRLKLRVDPGNLTFAPVRVCGDRVELRLTDLTTNRNASQEVVMRSPDTSSADWIAEAPSACTNANNCRVLPLTNFSAVQFHGARATSASGRTRTIADPAFSTTMLTLDRAGPALAPTPASFAPGSSAEATPSRLSRGDRSFTVRVRRTGPVLPPAPHAALDQLRRADRSDAVRWGR
jgi:hypothetical protein